MTDTERQSSPAISRSVFPALLLGVTAETRTETLVDESGMIGAQ